MSFARYVRLAAVVLVVASAQAGAERVALEGYLRDRPPEAQPVMTALWRVLARNGFADPVRLGKLFATHAWQPGGSKSVALNIAKKTAAGVTKFLDARLAEAEQELGQALALAHANPIAWVNEPKYRDEVMRALLYHALALGKQADSALASSSIEKNKAFRVKLAQQAEALGHARDDAMAELIRTFPSLVITSKEHGLDAESLFQRVRKELNAAGRGSLDLKLASSGAQVYIGERVPDPNKAIGDLLPGVYQVVVVDLGDAKQYGVEIFANKTSHLYVSSELDKVLVVDRWIGFRYPSEQEQTREPELVRELVGNESNATVAAVFSVERTGKTIAVRGRTYDVKRARLVTSCHVELARYDDEAELGKLVACLLDTRTIQVPTSTTISSSAPRVDSGTQTAANDAKDDPPNDADSEDTSAPPAGKPRWMLFAGLGGMVAGVAGGGLALKFGLDARDTGDELRRTCAVSCTSEQAKTLAAAQDAANRNALIAGVAGGAVFVAGAVVVGVYLVGRHGQPTVHASAQGVHIGWAVSY